MTVVSGRRLLVIVAVDYDSARAKGVDNLLLQYDEGGFFEKVILVSPYMRRDRVIQLSDRHVFVEIGSRLPPMLRWLGAPVHVVRVIMRCARIARRECISVIRATEPTLCGFIAWASARFVGIPYCVSLHADYDKRFELDGMRGAPTLFGSRALIRPLERFTLRRAVRVLPIRDSLVLYAAARGVPGHRIRVIPHGVDMTAFVGDPAFDVRAVLQLPSGKPIVSFVGRLSPENYVEDVLDAVRRVASKRDAFVFVMAGGGILGSDIAARLADDAVLRRVVRLVGFVPAATVAVLRRASAVSLCLMGGFSLIEACAAGSPVIACDVEWHRELIEDSITGRLVPEHDVTAIAAALEALLSDPAEARRLGENARVRAFSRHELRLTQQIKRDMYSEILAARRRAA